MVVIVDFVPFAHPQIFKMRRPNSSFLKDFWRFLSKRKHDGVTSGRNI